MKKKLLVLVLALAAVLSFSFSAMAEDEGLGDYAKVQEVMASLVNEMEPAVDQVEAPFLPEQLTSTLSAFSDIQNHWAKEYIEFVTAEELFNGTSATTFSPNENMTRAMFVTVLGRFCKVDTNMYQGASFSDVPTGTWYSPYVEWAAQNGVTNGFSDGTFRPEDNINREQMATLMLRFCNLTKIQITTISNYYTFNDEASISSYARNGVDYTKLTGLMTGKGYNMFEPKEGATRAEVATVMTRLVKASRGERIYINYNMAAVPTYSSVVLQPCLGTQYSANDVAIDTYDQNGIGFIYYYVPSELAVYQNYLVSQGFTMIEEATEENITAYIYAKGSIVMCIGVIPDESYLIIYPNVYLVV